MVGNEVDLTDVYDTERQLLHIACTRNRDRLLLCPIQPGGEFRDDVEARDQR